MKHDGFHLGWFATSFARNGINHSTKSSQVCWLVMTQAMGTLVQWRENNLRWTKSGMIGVQQQTNVFTIKEQVEQSLVIFIPPIGQH
jgi:hypothetical protein